MGFTHPVHIVVHSALLEELKLAVTDDVAKTAEGLDGPLQNNRYLIRHEYKDDMSLLDIASLL
jgi:hypothetical protein